IEGRIAEIEHKLAGAQVIDPAAIADAGGHVVFGATVDVEDATTGDRFTYQIVGEDEADLKHGKISVSSPIARALIGKSEGDVAGVAPLRLPYGLGFVQLRSALAIIGLVFVVNAAVYLFFRTRLNLRLADPSLTWLQIVLATSTVMASAFALDQGRAAALILCPVIMMYAVFRFTRRQFMIASAFVLVSYAV